MYRNYNHCNLKAVVQLIAKHQHSDPLSDCFLRKPLNGLRNDAVS